MTSVSATVNPSSTLDNSMNFFHPQSCSFLQNRCSVSTGGGAGAGGGGKEGGGGGGGGGGKEEEEEEEVVEVVEEEEEEDEGEERHGQHAHGRGQTVRRGSIQGTRAATPSPCKRA